MTITEESIIANYIGVFENLNIKSKIKLIEKLTNSLKFETKKSNTNFYDSFGGFCSEKSSDDIILEIKKSRKFKNKKINL